MKLIYVTERVRIKGDPYQYLDKLLSNHPDALMIREKDLSDSELLAFARPILSIGEKYDVPLILRGTPSLASELGIKRIHLSLAEVRQAPLPTGFDSIGVSIHQISEAIEAQTLGADYITYGHIFTSLCKPGLPPRGLSLLEELVSQVHIPVYAIGGITLNTLPLLSATDVAGACLMSASMTDDEPQTLTTRLRSALDQTL